MSREQEEKEEEMTMKGSERVEPLSGPDAATLDGEEREREKLRAEIAKKEEALREAQNLYLRTLADFENYRKRAQKEQADNLKYANERLIKELLPVIDNLERALTHSRETRDFNRMIEGVELIHKQILTAFGKFGVVPIESLNRPFDPLLHQSIGQVEVDEGSNVEENQIVGEVQKGYHLDQRLLRPSLVTIAKRKTPPS